MDILDLEWRQTGQTRQVPQLLISCRLVNSNNQSEMLDDMRESQAKHVLFPDVVAQLTGEERQELMEAIAMKLIEIRRARIGA